MEEEVEVGSIYEIDHSKLPRNSPVQLNPIRVAMVLEKNDLTVSLRYPSMSSLQTHFNNRHGSSSSSRPSSSNYRATTKSRMIIPALDEKYVMSSSFAGDVLYRKIPSQEWVERRQSWSFWVVPVPSMADASTENAHMDTDVVLQKGKCSLLSELKSTAMVKWGKRQRVRFIGRHNSTVQNDNSNLHHQSSSHIAIDGDEEKIEPTEEEEEEKIEEPTEDEEEEKIEPTEEEKEEKIELTEDEEDEEIEKVEEDDELEKVGSRQIRKNRKRKCKTRQNQIQTQHRGYSHKKQKVHKTTINRWSEERFKLAEKSMLKVMKAKGAMAGSPILRLELRQEARRYIGDTGLLDHLLKHMAGKVAPGGVERFRRRHNPEGAMEYWLESADLVRIRREAGVQDTYWIPPPGWKPGDNPSQDPILAMEMREIKGKMAQMERDMEELKSKRKEENQAIVTTPRSCIINQNMEDDSSSWLAAKEMCIEVVKRNGELEEQVMTLSQSLKKMEGEIVKLKCSSTVKQASGCRHAGTEKENKKGNHQKELFKLEHQEGDLQIVVADTTGKAKARSSVRRPPDQQQQEEENAGTTTTVAAEKAAMVQRLKSSFRICRPQGTFLWPTDMAAAAASPSQSLVPTTPSSCLSSTTTTTTTFPLPPPPPPPLVLHEPPSSPLKPLAKKPPIIKIKLPNINTTTSHGHGCMKSTLLDLNNAPSDNLNDTGNCATITSPTSSKFSSSSSDDHHHHHHHHHHGRSNIQLLPVTTTNTGGSSSSLSLCAAADAWLALAAAPPNSDPIN